MTLWFFSLVSSGIAFLMMMILWRKWVDGGELTRTKKTEEIIDEINYVM